MTSDFQKVEELYHQALSRPESERAQFLKSTCGGDEELRREVENLLSYQGKAGLFLNAPALDVAAPTLARSKDRNLVGGRLGPYEVLSSLGKGGMGEVYLSHDTRLERQVAIKVLPADVADDPDRLRRFVQEAKAVSALNHPNIATVYEIDEAEGVRYLVMEYVKGETLEVRTRKGGLGLAEILDIGVQAAEALQEAHAAGIIHRDVKPANLMLTPRGRVKILDFGLAKRINLEKSAEIARTITKAETMPGVIMGTIDYMSPEQILGQEVDHRTDLFSLGVSIYFMVTGRLPFSGGSPTETLGKVLHVRPETMARFNPEVPPELERIVNKALEKDRELRYQNASDLRADLQQLKHDIDSRKSAAITAQAPATKKPLVSRHRALLVPIALVLLTVIGLTVISISVYQYMERGAAIDSIAVLPFANTSGDPNTDYLGDGISESLINRLTRLPRLRVVPRSMAFRYRGRDVDTQEAGKELRVRSILTGRISQRGESLNIQTELVDVDRISQIWGAQYNRKLADIQTVQEEITAEISEKLQLRLTGNERELLTKRHTENTEAYRLYLKGLYYWNKRTEDAYKKGVESFGEAVANDPGYALAYVGLADCYNGLVNGSYMASRDAYPHVSEAAHRALALAENLAEARTSLAFVDDVYDWNWREAEKGYNLAIAVNPNYPTAHYWYGQHLDSMGRWDEAQREHSRAVELDPGSLVFNTQLGFHYYLARQYEEAVKQLNVAVEMNPNFGYAHAHLGSTYRVQPSLGDAVAEYQKAVALEPESPRYIAMLGSSYATAGKRSEALKILANLQTLSKRKYVDPVLLAYLLASLGMKEDALAALETGFESHSYLMRWLKVQPNFDPLRSNLRFQELLRRMHFPR